MLTLLLVIDRIAQPHSSLRIKREAARQLEHNDKGQLLEGAFIEVDVDPKVVNLWDAWRDCWAVSRVSQRKIPGTYVEIPTDKGEFCVKIYSD